jgi:hypothetical protein
MRYVLLLMVLTACASCRSPVQPDTTLHDCVISYKAQPDGSLKKVNSCTPK